MGIVRDLFYARKMGAGVKVPAPSVASYIKRMAYAPKSKTYEGEVVEFDTDKAKKFRELMVSLLPSQDLNGYSSPWIGTDYDQQPYVNRAVNASSVSELGNSEMDKIIGGTVAWNQLFTNSNCDGSSYPTGSTKSYDSQTDTTTYTGTMASQGYGYVTKQFYSKKDHVYLISANYDITGGGTFAWMKPSGGTDTPPSTAYTGAEQYYAVQKVAADYTTTVIGFSAPNGTTLTVNISKLWMVDLTALFGSAVADYINTLESGTAGAGVAVFKSLFPNDYYAYNAGSLQSVNTSAHKTYKADSTLLGNYALDSSLTLRGIPKLDANNRLYYDGDEYASDGTVTRKYGIVDLGTLTYSRTASGLFMTDGINSTVKRPTSTSNATGWLVSAMYEEMGSTPITGPDGQNPSPNLRMALNTQGALYFNNTSYTDRDAFKTAMDGVYLVYELATPTTESATPYTGTQSIDPNGTEEYVDYGVAQGTRDVAVPVGHYTNYANICPISGRTGASAFHGDEYDEETATEYSVSFVDGEDPVTVYAGTYDFVSGVLKARPYIASYNGETLVEPWLSSMDAYVAGTTPTTGAQVVDLGGTETVYQLSPQEITSLVGTNNVWSDAGQVTVRV